MRKMEQLPMDYFAATQGVSLTDGELAQALQDWLQKQGVRGTVAGVTQVAANDTVVALHVPVRAAGGHPCG